VRILLVHNHYGSSAPSGENNVVGEEKALLESNGHEIVEFFRYSDDIRSRGAVGALQGALATPWNPFMYRQLRKLVRAMKPDVVHVHNTFPLISPAIFHALQEFSIPRILTLHNYRLFCAAAIPMRSGQVCTECLTQESALPALRHGCYRDSKVATVPLAFNIQLHRLLGTWTNHVEAFITLTGFQSELMISAGLPQHKVYVKPNFYPGEPGVVPWAQRSDTVVFAGRLGEEKGVDLLLAAWREWGASAPQLIIVGDGPQRAIFEEQVRSSGHDNIRFTGRVSSEEAQEWIANSRLVVMPSRWFEGFPLVLREALALATPIVVSDLGPLPDLACNGDVGGVFAANDSESLLQAVRELWTNDELLHEKSKRAANEFSAKYTQEKNYLELMSIYGSAKSNLN